VTHGPFHASVLRPASQVGPMHKTHQFLQTELRTGQQLDYGTFPASKSPTHPETTRYMENSQGIFLLGSKSSL